MRDGAEAHRQLYRAAARGNVRTLCKLLLSGVDPDWYHPEDGLTCLQVAALEGRAECVYYLLLAGADMYAKSSQGCTAIEFYVQHKLLARVLDKLLWTRNYKACLEYLQKADAECQRRFHAMTEYQGIVVIHPSDELGLVCLPAGTALVCTNDGPAAAERAVRPALIEELPLDDGELRRHMQQHTTYNARVQERHRTHLRTYYLGSAEGGAEGPALSRSSSSSSISSSSSSSSSSSTTTNSTNSANSTNSTTSTSTNSTTSSMTTD